MNLPAAQSDSKSLPHNIRAIMRAENDCMLRRIDFVCGGLMNGDFLRAFVWNAICVENVRHVTQGSAAFQYAALFDFPPDKERVPISIQRLAEITRIPYETVRRQCLLLERDGLCRRVPGKGIFAPTATFQEPRIVEAAKAMVSFVQRLIADLKRREFDFAEIGRQPRAGAKDVASIMRTVVRLNASNTADLVALMRPPHDDDPIEAMVFMAIATENTRHLAPCDFATLDAVAPDATRRPVSINAIANSLKIPYETLRRMFNRMAKAGHVARVKDGFIVPAEIQFALETENLLGRRYALLLRFLADLQYVGMPMPG